MKKYTFECPHCGGTRLRERTAVHQHEYLDVADISGTESDDITYNTDIDTLEVAQYGCDSVMFICDDCFSEWYSTEDLLESGALVEKEVCHA